MPGILLSMGSQRVGHDGVTEQQQCIETHYISKNDGGLEPDGILRTSDPRFLWGERLLHSGY